MKCWAAVRYLMIVIMGVAVCSCVSPKADPSLIGRLYINKATQDRIEFTNEGTVIMTWSADQGYWSGQDFLGYQKDYPHEFSYAVYDSDRKMTVIYLTSGQALLFPYREIEISDSKDTITTTRNNGYKEVFMREN